MQEHLYTDGPAPPEFIEYLIWEHFHRAPSELTPAQIMEYLTVHSQINQWKAEQYKHG